MSSRPSGVWRECGWTVTTADLGVVSEMGGSLPQLTEPLVQLQQHGNKRLSSRVGTAR